VIDWQSDEIHLLLNPRMPLEERRVLERAAGRVTLPAHVLIASSGSTGAPRLVALSKAAILASAAAVNRHLDATGSDVWCSVLPQFHVGGLGIHARAAITGARVTSALWDAESFTRLCAAERVTLSALVPAQVVDLVRAGLIPPPSLRAVVVGGGALSDEAYKRARSLGWPVLPSYGMTECCSQVATATHTSPDLVILDHLQVRSVEDGRLAISGASLLTGYVDPEGGLIDPKREGWFVSSDLGLVEGRKMRVFGRVDDLVKIGGELVSVARLERLLESVQNDADAALVVVEDARLGSAIHLATSATDPERIVEAFNARAHPFERIRRVHRVEAIPRGSLGKVRREELKRVVARLLADEPG